VKEPASLLLLGAGFAALTATSRAQALSSTLDANGCAAPFAFLARSVSARIGEASGFRLRHPQAPIPRLTPSFSARQARRAGFRGCKTRRQGTER
jgi:hypothetical protein